MHIPPSNLTRFINLPQKRETEIPPNSDNPTAYESNKVDLIIGVFFAVAVVFGLLLCGLIKRSCLRRSKSKVEPSPRETQIETRPPSFLPYRPSIAGSYSSEVTLCVGSSNDPLKKELDDHISRPPPVLAASRTLVSSPGSRPSSTLLVATATSECTVKTGRSSSWESIGQRLDEKAGVRDSTRMSIARTHSPAPSSPSTPTSPSSPIRIPSPASLKDSPRYIYGSK